MSNKIRNLQDKYNNLLYDEYIKIKKETLIKVSDEQDAFVGTLKQLERFRKDVLERTKRIQDKNAKCRHVVPNTKVIYVDTLMETKVICSDLACYYSSDGYGGTDPCWSGKLVLEDGLTITSLSHFWKNDDYYRFDALLFVPSYINSKVIIEEIKTMKKEDERIKQHNREINNKIIVLQDTLIKERR